MSIKELRKRTPAPFSLSVLKRALEINPDMPDMETAIREYAEKMKKRPTYYDFYFVLPGGINQISVCKVSVETAMYQPIYRLLAVKLSAGNLEQKTVDEIMAIYGQNIKVQPIKTFTLKGSLNHYFHKSNNLSIIGVETVPSIERSELTDEILETLAKNVLYYFMDYQILLESKKCEIERLESHTIKNPQIIMPLFEKFMLNSPIEFGDSIVEKKDTTFYTNKTVQEYIEIATKKLEQTLKIPKLEIKIIQCEGYDLND